MLKLKTTLKHTQEKPDTKKSVQPQMPDNTEVLPINPNVISQAPSTRQVKNTTGALLSKLTKKFERWKPKTRSNLTRLSPRQQTNGTNTNTK